MDTRSKREIEMHAFDKLSYSKLDSKSVEKERKNSLQE